MIDSLGLPDDLLNALDPNRVRTYLNSNGWFLDLDYSDDEAETYRLTAQPGVEILLPLILEFADFADRMADLIHVLSLVDKRLPLVILNDLLAPDGDVFRFRLAAPYSSNGILPFTKGVNLFLGTRKSILAVACSAHSRLAVFAKQSYKQADEFLDKCKLAQTEVGSYVITIINPIPTLTEYPEYNALQLDLDDKLLLEKEPFSRRVSILLASSLGVISESVKSGSPDMIIDGVSLGVSANLCEALVEMKPSGKRSKLEIQVKWSSVRPRTLTTLPSKVVFQNDDFEIIKEAAQELRGNAREVFTRIEGYVEDLHAALRDGKGWRGKVMIRRTDDSRGSLVSVILGETDYALACDAHRDKRRVSIAGKLFQDRKMRFPQLREYLSFKVLD